MGGVCSREREPESLVAPRPRFHVARISTGSGTNGQRSAALTVSLLQLPRPPRFRGHCAIVAHLRRCPSPAAPRTAAMCTACRIPLRAASTPKPSQKLNGPTRAQPRSDRSLGSVQGQHRPIPARPRISPGMSGTGLSGARSRCCSPGLQSAVLPCGWDGVDVGHIAVPSLTPGLACHRLSRLRVVRRRSQRRSPCVRRMP